MRSICTEMKSIWQMYIASMLNRELEKSHKTKGSHEDLNLVQPRHS